MGKQLKKIVFTVFILLAFVVKTDNIKAASCKIGVSAPNSVVVGKSFNVTVTVSSNEAIGSWEYTLSYDSSKVKLNSGALHVAEYGNGSSKSKTYTYSFTGLTSGVATFKPVNTDIYDYASEAKCLSGTASASVTMKTQAEIEATYSKNNNLSSLQIEGAELTPSFSKDKLEYSATLPVDTTKANVSATPEDKTASIQGIGEIDVVDGLNKIEVVVTAQHGEKKTYVINLTVEELDPITVKVNGKDYTVVRKKGQIENIPTGFSETTIKIDNQDIVAYKSELSKLILVVLKNSEGENNLFIYDEASKKYEYFEEVKGLGTNLLLINYDGKDIPTGFVKTTVKINDKEINAYKLEKDSNNNYYLIYAKNLENGKDDFYLYDKQNNTYQIFYEDMLSMNQKDIENMKLIIMCLFIPLVVIIFILFICLLKKMFTSKDKKIIKYKKKIEKLSSKIEVNNDEEEKPLIEQVDNDEYLIRKKSRKQRLQELEETKKRLEEQNSSIRRVTLEDDDE